MRIDAVEGDLEQPIRRVLEVSVGIDEARQQQASLEIDQLRRGSPRPEKLPARADIHNAIASHGNRLRLGPPVVDRPHSGVMQDEVWGLSLREREAGDAGEDRNDD